MQTHAPELWSALNPFRLSRPVLLHGPVPMPLPRERQVDVAERLVNSGAGLVVAVNAGEGARGAEDVAVLAADVTGVVQLIRFDSRSVLLL